MGRASRSKRAGRASRPRGHRRELVQRIQRYESRIDQRLPGWVNSMDHLREVAREEYGSWPEWCLVPMPAPYAIAVHHGLLQWSGLDSDGRPDTAGLQWPTILAALYAWRQGRGIYRYDPELAEAVATSDLPSDIGTDMLFRLPEWGLYIDAADALGSVVVGFWVFLAWDVKARRAELRFVWDMADGTLEILPVHLGHTSLAEAMDSVLDNAQTKAAEHGLTEADLQHLDQGTTDFDFDLIRRALMLVLYLCTDDADVTDPDAPARRHAGRCGQGPTSRSGRSATASVPRYEDHDQHPQNPTTAAMHRRPPTCAGRTGTVFGWARKKEPATRFSSGWRPSPSA